MTPAEIVATFEPDAPHWMIADALQEASLDADAALMREWGCWITESPFNPNIGRYEDYMAHFLDGRSPVALLEWGNPGTDSYYLATQISNRIPAETRWVPEDVDRNSKTSGPTPTLALLRLLRTVRLRNHSATHPDHPPVSRTENP